MKSDKQKWKLPWVLKETGWKRHEPNPRMSGCWQGEQHASKKHPQFPDMILNTEHEHADEDGKAVTSVPRVSKLQARDSRTQRDGGVSSVLRPRDPIGDGSRVSPDRGLLTGNKSATMVQVYATTNPSADDVKDEFNSSLLHTLDQVRRGEVIILLGYLKMSKSAVGAVRDTHWRRSSDRELAAVTLALGRFCQYVSK